MAENPPLSLAGRTQQWRFDGGPTAGKTYEHTFRADGSVVFREVAAGEQAKAGADGEVGTRYASFEVGPGMHLVSYLSGSGFTLTVLVNRSAKTVHGFASNEKSWYPVQGALVADR